MARLPSRALLLLMLALAGACSGNRKEGGTIRSRDVLTREQLDEVHATNAYEAVQRLRSAWLRLRGTTQMPSDGGAQFRENQVLVYLDDQRLGEIETLRSVEIAAVQYIRFYPPAQAAARWGFNHGGGVIFVSTRPMTRTSGG